MTTASSKARRHQSIGYQWVLFYWFFWLFCGISLPFTGTLASGKSQVLDEIRLLLHERDFYQPAPAVLAMLNPENFEEQIKLIDPFARYTPPSPTEKDLGTPLGVAPPDASPGIEILQFESKLWVRAEAGGPADRAGVPEIGLLTAVNEIPVQGTSLASVSELIDFALQEKSLRLSVVSNPGKPPRVYPISSYINKNQSVVWRWQVGMLVIRIKSFVAHDTAVTFRALYKTLVRTETPVVLDLRGSTGGDLQEAFDIAGMYVPVSMLLAQGYDRAGLADSWRSPSGRKFPAPKLILIDRRTASAAEVLAGILHHHHMGRLLGETSTGKCASQTMSPLSDGGTLWYTNLSIRFPDGTTCTGRGIEPDVRHERIMIEPLAVLVGQYLSRQAQGSF